MFGRHIFYGNKNFPRKLSSLRYNDRVMKQVVVIHGGTSFDQYQDYIDFLKTREVSREKLLGGEDWKAALPRELGDSFEVLLPKMPNATNARYAEWSLWLERCLPFVREPVILVGHSLGGIFLAKYLAERDFPRRILAALLVAAPFDDCSTDESLADFVLPASLQKFSDQADSIYLMHSQDDPVVPVEQTAKYQRALPKASVMILDGRQHFQQAQFPELAALIASL